jgi:hypothetical protein
MLDLMKENSLKDSIKEVSSFLGREKLRDFISEISKARIEKTSKKKKISFNQSLIFLFKIESENTLYREDDYDTWFINSIFTLNGELYLKQIFNILFEKINLMPDSFEVNGKFKSFLFCVF